MKIRSIAMYFFVFTVNTIYCNTKKVSEKKRIGGVIKMDACNASLAIQVLPAVEGEEVIHVVDKVIAYLKSTGLSTFVGPFETTIEGDFDQIMDIAKECQKICIRAGASSVMTYMKVAYNPSVGVWSIDKKVTKHHS